MASVEIRDVHKRFGATPVIRGVNVSIADGEFAVLVGPSGCGKSTLLRMVAGLEPVTAGTVHIGERDVTTVLPPDRDIAMVFQNYALYPHMTVRRNLGFGLRQRGTHKAVIGEKVEAIARMLGLGDLLERRQIGRAHV